MRKASKWLCGIFGLTRTDVARDQHSSSKPPRHKRRWNLIRSFCRKNSSAVAVTTDIDCINNHVEPSMHINHNEHAITTADEAAVVTDRVTGSSSSSSRLNMEIAAVTIQRVYRGHLARRALRALKAIVKVQAIVRGRIERKRAAEWLRRMQALMRRARIHARTGQFRITPSTQSTHSHQAIQGPLTPENCECGYRSKSRKSEQPPMVKSSGRILDNHETLYLGWNRSHLQIDEKIRDEEVHSTRVRSRWGSSKGSTFPVAKSTNESRRYLSGSSDHPNNYMAHTESSKAKVMSPWSWVAYDKHGEVAENTIVLDPPLAIEGEKEMLKWEQEAQAPGSIERNIKWKVNEDTTIKRRRKRGTHTSTKP